MTCAQCAMPVEPGAERCGYCGLAVSGTAQPAAGQEGVPSRPWSDPSPAASSDTIPFGKMRPGAVAGPAVPSAPVSGSPTPMVGTPVAGQGAASPMPAPGQGAVPVSQTGGAPPPGIPPAPAVPAQPSPPAGAAGGGGRVLGVVAVLVALALGAALVGVALRARDGGSQTAAGTVEPIAADDPAYDLDADAVVALDGDGGAVEDPAAPACAATDNSPRLVKYWQDMSGLHVVITIFTTCSSPQVLNDPQAQFGLYLSDRAVVTGTFDLSSSPVRVPASGESGEIELVFDREAFHEFGLRGGLVLPSSEQQARSGGFSLRYRFVCEPGEGGQTEVQVGSDSSADLGDAASDEGEGDAPTTPDPADETDALRLLEEIHAADEPARQRIAGKWLPQVSQKTIGEATPDYFLDNQQIVHTASVILNRFWAWENEYAGDAFLLRGSDFPSICATQPNERCWSAWIVAIEVPHATGEDVVRVWCENERLNYFLDGTPIYDSTQRNCHGARYSSETSGTGGYVFS